MRPKIGEEAGEILTASPRLRLGGDFRGDGGQELDLHVAGRSRHPDVDFERTANPVVRTNGRKLREA
jgi:hypothetical protein